MSEIIVFLLLLISLSANALMFWYIRKLLQEFRYITDNYDDIGDVLGEFSDHLERVHGLETFYGDETLKGLIDHSREVVEEIKDFTRTFATEGGEEKEQEDDETEEEE